MEQTHVKERIGHQLPQRAVQDIGRNQPAETQHAQEDRREALRQQRKHINSGVDDQQLFHNAGERR
jgi:hypothetical protein